MSINNKLYNCYKKILNCPLVKSKEVNKENLEEFEKLLNSSLPNGNEEVAQYAFCRTMYYSNTIGFVRYVSFKKNKVSSHILWTESRQIIRYFGLQGLVHLSWNKETGKYVANKYIADPEKRNASK
jgi:hypothetical protein